MQDGRPKAVRGPNGETITLADIPVGNPKRWLPTMKARVIAAIDGGLISMDDAWRKYRLSRREYEYWKGAVAHSEGDQLWSQLRAVR